VLTFANFRPVVIYGLGGTWWKTAALRNRDLAEGISQSEKRRGYLKSKTATSAHYSSFGASVKLIVWG